MANEISQRLRLLNPGNLDDWYGPYDSVELANSAVPSVVRIGKTVGVDTDTGIVEYWWNNGIEDEDLVIKQSDVEDHFKGYFTTLEFLQQAYPTAEEGDYAYVDSGEGEPVKQYIWDSSDSEWQLGSGGPVSFGNLTGDPYDNIPLGEDLIRIEGKTDEAQEEIIEINEIIGDEIALPMLDGLTNVAVAYGIKRLKTGANKAFRLRRSSDNVTSDFYFNFNGNLNVSQISQFLYGDKGFIERWYDQSGNGNDAIQATPSLQPCVYIQNGDIVVMFENNGNSTVGQQLNYTTSNIDVRNTTVFCAHENYVGSGMDLAPVPTFTKRYLFSSQNQKLDLYINANNIGGANVDYDFIELFSGSAFTNKTLFAYTSANYFCINSSSSNLKLDVNYKSETLGAVPSYVENNFSIGNKFTGQSNPFTGSIYNFIHFTTSQTQDVIDGLKDACYSAFNLVDPSFSNLNVVLEGDSLTSGIGATYNQNYARQLNSVLKAPVLDVAISGNTTVTIALKKNHVDKNIITGKTNLLIVWIGTNDTGITEAESYANLVTYVQARRVAGWNKIYVLTCIARVSTIKSVFNGLIVGNTADFDAVIDVAKDYRFQVKTGLVNTVDRLYYIADGIHLNNAGYRGIASVIDPYIDQNNVDFNQTFKLGYRLSKIERIISNLQSLFLNTGSDTPYNSSISIKGSGYIPSIIGSSLPGGSLTLRGNDTTNGNNQGYTIIEPTGDGRVGVGTATPIGQLSLVKPTTVQRGQALHLILANLNTAANNLLIFHTSDSFAENTARGSVGYNTTRGFGMFSQTNLNITFGGSGGALSISGLNTEMIRLFNNTGIALFPKGITGFNPTAYLHIAAGGTAAGSAQLKLNTGSLLTTPEAGALEFSANRLYFTKTTGTVRETLAYVSDVPIFVSVSNTTDVVDTAFLNTTYPVASFPIGTVVNYYNQGKEYRRVTSTVWTYHAITILA